jgi:hypothetical protein
MNNAFWMQRASLDGSILKVGKDTKGAP